MGVTAARLFAWLQDAAFYRDMHLAAVNLLPRNGRGSWLDVGCGPGLLTRIAAERGCAARGIDRDPGMIGMARQIADVRGSNATFAIADLDQVAKEGMRYDVVSASSLLIALPDPDMALRRLIALAKPQGMVLIIEAAGDMTLRRALSKILFDRLGRRAYMLVLWAAARSGRTLDERIFDRLAPAERSRFRVTRHSLLGGLANAWIIETIPTPAYESET